MKSSCLSIEKPQSSNRSARSQNVHRFQITQSISYKRHCRASGFVPEPSVTEILHRGEWQLLRLS